MLVRKGKAISRVVSIIVVTVIVVGAFGAYYFVSVNNFKQTSGTASTPSSTTSGITTTVTFTSSTSTSTFTTVMTSSTTSIITGTGIAPFNGNWGNLRGATYKWNDLSSHPDGGNSPPPSTSFAMYHDLGFNLARVDTGDWQFSDTNSSVFASGMAQIADASDANGVYCIYWAGGSNNFYLFPTSLTGAYASSGDFYNAWWQNGVVPSGKFAGMTLWEALFQGFTKPLYQAVGSHPSTIGFAYWNEPAGLPPNGLQLMHNFYQYEAQRLRTLTSTIAFVFQVNPGTSNNVNSAPLIVAIAPASDLKPYVFESHMYSYDSGVLSAWIQGATQAGAYGFIGETHITTDINFYTQLHNAGWATEYYRWSCDSLLTRGTCQLTSAATQLSQIYAQVWGSS